MLGNGNGRQRLVEDWSEDEATFVSVPGRQSVVQVGTEAGHTKVDIVKGPATCCGRCSTATRMSGLGVAAWGVAAAAQCQTRGCPGYRGPQGDPEDTSDDMPLLFSPAGAASPGPGHSSRDLELQDHCHGLEPVRDSGKVARRQLALATLLCTVFVTGEVVGGWVSGSLAIMSDAAHMFSDLASFGVSLLVLYVSERKATKKMTFGYHRAEALGALATLCIIWYVTGILVYLAVRRIHDNDFEIHETAMVVVASCAVVFNILLGLILHGVCGLGHGHSHGGGHGHGHSHGAGGDTKHINIRAAAIHVLGDLLQSIGVLISSVLIKCFGPEFKIADPICTLVFAVIVVVTTFTVLRDTLAILLEGAPPGLKYDVVATDLASIGDVVSVHSLHIWSLTADIPVLSVHLTTKQDADHNIIRNEAIKTLRTKHKIWRSTVQVESHQPQLMSGCDKCQPLAT